MAKHIQFDDYGTGHNANCVACEELFADALDNLLSPADQLFFDQHLRTCAGCSESFAQAQRGAAWLELLKSSQPEPSAHLVQRILNQTIGAEAPAAIPVSLPLITGIPALPHNVIPFTPRPVSRFTRFTRLAMEPRLAMTAAMAFFSIALTLNLLGVRLDQIKAANFSPTNLKQTYFQANATAVRYYDNLKVVRVLESRVDDIRQSNADDALPAQPQAQPQPETKPEPQPQPDQKPAPKQQDTPHGSSRRESPLPIAPRILNAHLDFSTEPLRRPLFVTESYVAAPISLSLQQEGGLA
jgi:hypothetical protein